MISGKRYRDIAADFNLAKNVMKVYAIQVLNATGVDDRYDLALRFTAE